MNQILSVESPQNRKKRSNRSSTHSILIVFAVILIIFGIGLTSTGAYSYYRSLSNNLNESIVSPTSTKPVITIERESASTINIVVTHDKAISNVTYKINDEKPIQIDGADKTEVQEEVELPIGESTITINAKDINGISSSYESSFKVEQKPIITLEQVDGKIQATTESKINIDYIRFYWDDDEVNGKQVTINDIKNVTLIDVIEGTHTLNIIAVDVEGNRTTKTQKVIGDNKPELTVTTNGEVFIINATDDEELTKVEITLNSNETKTEEINNKEYSTTVDLVNGENKLTVTVYNKNGLSETSRVKYTKE